MTSATKPILTGGCQCGAIRFAVSAPPVGSAQAVFSNAIFAKSGMRLIVSIIAHAIPEGRPSQSRSGCWWLTMPASFSGP